MDDVDIGRYHALLHPNNDTDPVGDDIDSPLDPIVEGTPGALFPSVAIPALASPDVLHRYEGYVQNDHATETFASGRMWILNGLILPSVAGVVTFVTNTAETGYALIVGEVAGVPDSEFVDLTGAAGSYMGVNLWDANEILWVMLMTATSGGTTWNALDNIEVWRGVQLGTIPGPYNTGTVTHQFYCATAEYELGLALALNAAGAVTATNRLTNPAGITFSRPVTEDTSILLPGDLTPGDYCGYWMRRTIKAGYLRPPAPIVPTTILSGVV